MQPRILLVGPSDLTYQSALSDFADGFAKAGCRVWSLAAPFDTRDLTQWVRRNDIQLVLDINGLIDPDVEWPESAILTSWFHDYYYNKAYCSVNPQAKKSYFVFDPSIFNFPVPDGACWSLLSPGASLSPYSPSKFRCDVSFCGHISHAIGDQKIATAEDGGAVNLRQFLRHYPERYYKQSTFSLYKSRKKLAEICEALNWTLMPEADHFFENNLVRFYERASVLWSAANVTNSLEIYGVRNWLEWKNFVPYYRGEIKEKEDLIDLYSKSKINIHNGTLGLHSRVFDCLGAGGFLLFLETPRDRDLCGIATEFEAGVHYDAFSLETAREVISKYLRDENKRSTIARSGRRLIEEKHTWMHRAIQILGDFGFQAAANPRQIITKISGGGVVNDEVKKVDDDSPIDRIESFGKQGIKILECEDENNKNKKVKNHFYVLSFQNEMDECFQWFRDAMGIHSKIVVYRGGRDEFVRETSNEGVADLIPFTTALNEFGGRDKITGDFFTSSVREIKKLRFNDQYFDIPAISLVRNPLSWLKYYIEKKIDIISMSGSDNFSQNREWCCASHEMYHDLGLKSYRFEDVEVWNTYRGFEILNSIHDAMESRIIHFSIEKIADDPYYFHLVVKYLTQDRCRFDQEEIERAYSMFSAIPHGNLSIESDSDEAPSAWPDWKSEAFKKIVRPNTVRTFMRFGYDLRDLASLHAV